MFRTKLWFVALVGVVLIAARARAGETTGDGILLVVMAPTALIPVPHVEFGHQSASGTHSALMLAWPLRMYTFAWAPRKNADGSGFRLGLTPDLEPQVSFTGEGGVGRVVAGGQAWAGYFNSDDVGWSLLVETGGVVGGDGHGVMGGAGVSFGWLEGARDGLMAQVGLVVRESWLTTGQRYDVALNFHFGLVK